MPFCTGAIAEIYVISFKIVAMATILLFILVSPVQARLKAPSVLVKVR
jgi:hypothetical protein